jgi:hypothetical protein
MIIKNKKFLLLTPLVLLTMMCGVYNLDTDYFAKNEPAQADLIGTYEPTVQTLGLIQGELGYTPTDIFILLKSDNTFQMSNVPDAWRASYDSIGEPTSSQGTWKVAPDQEWWGIDFDFEDTVTIAGIGGVFMPLSGQEPPYYLWIYVGDPDSGKVMIFEQASDMVPGD